MVLGEQNGVVEVRVHGRCVGAVGVGLEQPVQCLERQEADGLRGFRGIGAAGVAPLVLDVV